MTFEVVGNKETLYHDDKKVYVQVGNSFFELNRRFSVTTEQLTKLLNARTVNSIKFEILFLSKEVDNNVT